nr:LacI family DNA-binding transcriptional regulator [Streptomyces sp. LBUM 1481]
MEPTAPRRRITIVDVARHARVSVTSVSKVLRNAYGASPEMQAKVRRAIEELGYRPHAGARALRGQTYTIGVMLPDIRNPFFPEILDGVTESLEETDYQVFLGPGCNGEKAEARVTEAMIDRGMDGLILVAPVSSRAHLEHVAAAVPTVVVGRHGSSALYDTVADDDAEGAALVVRHLAGLGHHRIAHVEHHETDTARLAEMPNARRADGYRQAMRVQGLAEQIDVISTSYSQEGGHRAAQELLARPRPPGRPPSSPGRTSSPWGCWKRSPTPDCRFPATSRWPVTTTPRSPRSARSRSPASTRPAGRWAATPYGSCWIGSPTTAARRPR